MDLKHETRSFIVTGCVVAIVCAVPLGFFIGIGGALVSAVVGILATCVVGVIRNRIAQNTQRSLEGHTQIQGVLDSSQLGKDEDKPATQDVMPFARHGKLVAVAVSLAFCLVTAGIVGAATRGVGINFYLGGTPQTTTSKNASSASSSTKRTTEGSQERTQSTSQEDGVVETWYPPTEEVPQNTGTEQQQQNSEPSSSSSSTDPSPTPSPSSSSSQGSQSGESQGSGNTPDPGSPSSEPSTQTQAPANSGTINDASQNAKEQ